MFFFDAMKEYFNNELNMLHYCCSIFSRKLFFMTSFFKDSWIHIKFLINLPRRCLIVPLSDITEVCFWLLFFLTFLKYAQKRALSLSLCILLLKNGMFLYMLIINWLDCQNYYFILFESMNIVAWNSCCALIVNYLAYRK